MRGKTTACDNCRNKKVKCEGKFPCKYCSDRHIECTNLYKPKRIAQYTRKLNNKVVGVRQIHKKDVSIEDRLDKMETLIHNFIKGGNYQDLSTQVPNKKCNQNIKISKKASNVLQLPSTKYSEQNKYPPKYADFKLESLETTNTKKYSLTFTVKGLIWIADFVNDNYVKLCMNNLITQFIESERRFLSSLVEPKNTSRLSTLPPRNIMNLLLDSFDKVGFFDLPFLSESRRNISLFCDYRDGLIPYLNFSYGELLLLNAILYLSCTAHYEILKIGISSELDLSIENVLRYERILKDNSLYYYNKIHFKCDGIHCIQGIICLILNATISFSSGISESLSSCAFIHAQNIGLHTAEYYTKLRPKEAQIALPTWWMVYFMYQISALKSGKTLPRNNKKITAPPLLFAQQFCDISGRNGLRASLRRAELHKQISLHYEDCLMHSESTSKFFFVMLLDITIIMSRVQSELLSESSKSNDEYISSVESILNDLENWRLSLPKSAKSGNTLFKGFKFKEMKVYDTIRKIFSISELNVNYYHVKLIVALLAIRHSEGELQQKYIHLSSNTSRESIHFILYIAEIALPAAGFALFSTFTAFLNLSAYCIQSPTNPNVEEDVKLLISSCKKYFACFASVSTKFSDKWKMVGAVSKCIISVVIRTVMDNNNHLYFKLGDTSNEILEIQRFIDSIMKPISAKMITPYQESITDLPLVEFKESVSISQNSSISSISSISTKLYPTSDLTPTSSFSYTNNATVASTIISSSSSSSTSSSSPSSNLFWPPDSSSHHPSEIEAVCSNKFHSQETNEMEKISSLGIDDPLFGSADTNLIAEIIFKDSFDLNSILNSDQGL